MCLAISALGSLMLAFWLVPAPVVQRLGLSKSGYGQLEGWKLDFQGRALTALRRSCAVMTGLPEARSIGPDAIGGHARDWKEACSASGSVNDQDHADSRAFFEAWFQPFLVTYKGDERGLFTGYYEPTLRGSLTPDTQYKTPLLASPADLVHVRLGDFRGRWAGDRIFGRVIGGRLRPYASRAEIVSGALEGIGLEIMWVDNPIDAFFMHVQGSGRIVLPDGGTMRLGYAGQNGHPYTSIGRELINDGALTPDAVSMQSIRAWLEMHPTQASDMLNRNASYIFFRIVDQDGPIGAQNVILTPRRSLAVDNRFIPLGVPMWVETKAPAVKGGDEVLRRLMIAQDTGGAIRGAVRGDIFWGAGPDAAEVAGRMKHEGRYYLLLPRGRAENE